MCFFPPSILHFTFYLSPFRSNPHLFTPRRRRRRPPRYQQVLGDVNPESEIVAGGDVFVWGSLCGDVTAGVEGDTRAQVFSLDMRPSSVTIGSVTALNGDAAGDGAGAGGAAGVNGVASGVPEVATVVEGSSQRAEIVVTPASAAAARLSARESKQERRTRSAMARKAAYVTGIYIAAAGLALLIRPAQVFGLLFSIEGITDPWIRVFGTLCVAFGTYYWGTAFGDWHGMGADAFYISTIFGRVFIFAVFCAMVATGRFTEPALLLLGLINFVGALFMMHALNKGRRQDQEVAGV